MSQPWWQAAILALVAVLATCVLAQPCAPRFVAGYAGPSLQTGAACAAMFDDHSGTGPALFIGGGLKIYTSTASLAKFVDGRFIAIGNFNGAINTMLVRSENGQQVLYLGGSFTTVQGLPTSGVTRWDGISWTMYPGPTPHNIHAIAFYNDGSGDALYAAGTLTTTSPTTRGIAKWTGSTWAALGSGLAGQPSVVAPVVRSLHVFDDGQGPKLFVGGDFTTAGGITTQGVATWGPSGWQAANNGLTSGTWRTQVWSFATHDDGDGPKLYAAGVLNTPSRATGNTWVVRLDDNGVWMSVLGQDEGVTNGAARALLSHNDGSGPALYAATDGSVDYTNRVRVLRDGTWSQLANFNGPVNQVLHANIGQGPQLAAIGDFSSTAYAVAAYSNNAWTPIETWQRGRLAPITSMTVDPEGSDGHYWIGAGCYFDGNLVLDHGFVRRPSKGLSRLHLNGFSYLVASGTQTGVTGDLPFDTAVQGPTGWTFLPHTPYSLQMTAVAHDEEGEFIVAATAYASTASIYKFINNAWLQLGPDIPISSSNGRVSALQTYDHGAGPTLYVGGLMNAGGLLRLENNQWVPVPGLGLVNDLCIFNFGAGPELVVAGTLDTPSGPNSVARWNGATVRDIGAGVPGSYIWGQALTLFDRGQGPQLFLGLSDTANPLRFWNGSTWSNLGSFTAGSTSTGLGRVFGLAPIRRPDGSRSLFIGGEFTIINGTRFGNIAEYAACRPSCTSDFNQDGTPATDADIEAFFACLAGSCCPTCATADFNNDGDSATDADIESFFRVLAAGPC